MSKQLEIYRHAKLDILQSKNIIELSVARSYMNLAKMRLNFTQWNDLLRNYELKKRQLCLEV